MWCVIFLLLLQFTLTDVNTSPSVLNMPHPNCRYVKENQDKQTYIITSLNDYKSCTELEIRYEIEPTKSCYRHFPDIDWLQRHVRETLPILYSSSRPSTLQCLCFSGFSKSNCYKQSPYFQNSRDVYFPQKSTNVTFSSQINPMSHLLNSYESYIPNQYLLNNSMLVPLWYSNSLSPYYQMPPPCTYSNWYNSQPYQRTNQIPYLSHIPSNSTMLQLWSPTSSYYQQTTPSPSSYQNFPETSGLKSYQTPPPFYPNFYDPYYKPSNIPNPYLFGNISRISPSTDLICYQSQSYNPPSSDSYLPKYYPPSTNPYPYPFQPPYVKETPPFYSNLLHSYYPQTYTPTNPVPYPLNITAMNPFVPNSNPSCYQQSKIAPLNYYSNMLPEYFPSHLQYKNNQNNC